MNIMKRLMKYPLVLVTTLLFMISCSDNFLSTKPKSFFTPDNTFKSPAGFKAALITCRKNLTTEDVGNKSLMVHQWITSDAAIATLQMDFRRLTPSNDAYMRFVSQINIIYRYIKNANVIISRIDNIKWEKQTERNAILAAALWYRAYWYYRLVGNYGNVPWIGKEVSGAKLDFNTYTRAAILHKIQSDLEFAVQHLPIKADPGVVTQGAGNQLLTKVYLANLEFDKAIEAATRVIDGPYALMSQRFGVDAGDPKRNVIWDLHRPTNMNDPQNKETILAIVDRPDAPPGARSNGLYTMRIYNSSWWHPVMKDSLGNDGMIDAGAAYDTLGRGDGDAALTEWYQYHVWNEGKYTWKSTPDLRRADINWVDINEMRYNNPESVNYGEHWKLKFMTGKKIRALDHMYAMPFYITYAPEAEPNATPLGGNGDWYIYRLAGTYLLRAEAYYWKGELGLAAADINKVRNRAHAPAISARDVTINYIFDERARELFAETPRQNEMVRVSYIMAEKGNNGYSVKNLNEDNWWYDRLIEYNSFYPQYTGPFTMSLLGFSLPPGDNYSILGQSPHISPYNYLWPISDNMINANTLGTINQNIGYNGAQNNKPPKEQIEETSYE